MCFCESPVCVGNFSSVLRFYRFGVCHRRDFAVVGDLDASQSAIDVEFRLGRDAGGCVVAFAAPFAAAVAAKP